MILGLLAVILYSWDYFRRLYKLSNDAINNMVLPVTLHI